MKASRIQPVGVVLLSSAMFLCGCGKTPSPSLHKSSTSSVSSSTNLTASKPSADETEPSPETPLSVLPPEVQKTILANSNQGEITSIERYTEDGEVVFEVSLGRSFCVGTDGTLLRYQVVRSELPAAVQSILEKDFHDPSVGQIDREGAGEETVYVGEIVEGGYTNRLTIPADGKSWHREIEPAQVPPALLQKVRSMWGKLEITSVTMTSVDGTVVYEFQTDQEEGRQRSLTLAPDAQVVGLEDEIPWTQVPIPVKNAAKRGLAGGEPVRTFRSSSAEGIFYRIEARKNGQPTELWVDRTGNLLTAADAESPNSAR